MSFASLLATDSFISFMSDGRVTSVDNTIVQEGYSKLHRVSDEIILAMTGSKDNAERILDNIHMYDKSSVESFTLSLLEGITDNGPTPQVLMLIGGRNRLGKLVFTSVNTMTTHYSLDTVEPGGVSGEILYNSQNLSFNAYEYFGVTVQNALKNNKIFDKETAFNIQKELNDKVAKEDITVNTRIFHEIIFK
ncbi:hypothetical protein SAMN04487786_1077 [Paenisporosarcina quisquiliarum]|nr:hypothetical protein SAMN04487786_1077 [Paenisporosarcina quisquiliarum]